MFLIVDRLQTESGKNTAFKHSIVAQLYNIWIHKATKTSFPCITSTLFYKEYVNPLQPLRSNSALQSFFSGKSRILSPHMFVDWHKVILHSDQGRSHRSNRNQDMKVYFCPNKPPPVARLCRRSHFRDLAQQISL